MTQHTQGKSQRKSLGAAVSSTPINPRKETQFKQNWPDEDILVCHICHKVQGTFPVIQAHYRDNHGYEPQRRSPSSSPEALRPQKKYNERGSQTEDPPLSHTRQAETQRRGRPINQNVTRIVNIQLECDECGFQTEDPSSLRTHQAGMHRTRTALKPANPINITQRQGAALKHTTKLTTDGDHLIPVRKIQ